MVTMLEAMRYYGKDGLKVQEQRKITLLPPASGYISREELELEVVVVDKTSMNNSPKGMAPT